MIEFTYFEVNSVLSGFCGSSNFLLQGRLTPKTLESVKDKLDSGRFESLYKVDDILAFSVIVDLSSQVPQVVEFLSKAFLVVRTAGQNTLHDERIFDFDVPRVYCRLGSNVPSSSGLEGILFEVQVRTILQHAWSKITHPLVYKSNVYDEKSVRLAAELLAQLESLDRVFVNFNTIASSVKTVRRKEMVGGAACTAMVDELIVAEAVPREFRPKNGRRLGENIYSAIKRSKRNDVPAVIVTLKSKILTYMPFPYSCSIFELVVLALFELGSLELGSANKPRYFLLSDELCSLFPIASNIPNRVRLEQPSAA